MNKKNKSIIGNNNPVNNNPINDGLKIGIKFLMPFAAKMALNLIPRDKWQQVVSDKKSLWEAATIAIPWLTMSLTNLSPVLDDLIGDFFEEVNEEIRRRESGEETRKNEHQIKANLLDLIVNEADKDVILNNYVDVFSLAPTHQQHHHLVEFINTLKPEGLLSLLRLEKAQRDKFITLVIGAPKKETQIFQQIDDYFAPGTPANRFAERLKAFSKKF